MSSAPTAPSSPQSAAPPGAVPQAVPEAVPEAVDVVVIGGGIIGTTAAYFLAKKGVAVALCEKGRIAGEQSSRNWGFTRQQGRDPRELPMAMESLRIWRRLGEEIGEDVGFRQVGTLYTSNRPKDIALWEAWIEVAKQHQLDTQLLSARDVQALLPDSTARWAGAMHTPSDGRAEPRKAAPAVARAAARAGAHVLTGCAVRGLETAAGRVAGVVTEHGTIKAAAVVCAAGAWSRLFCGSLGIPLPQLTIKSTALRTTPVSSVTESALWTPEVAIRRRDDGGYTVAHGAYTEHHIVPASFRWFAAFMPAYRRERHRLRFRLGEQFLVEARTPRRWPLDRPSPFEATRVLDPPPSRRPVERSMVNLRRLFPSLREARVAEAWAGFIDATPDAVPVVSAIDALPGFFLATGFSGHGFGIGPGAGKLVAELVADATPSIDLKPFRYSRFFEGVRVEPHDEL